MSPLELRELRRPHMERTRDLLILGAIALVVLLALGAWSL